MHTVDYYSYSRKIDFRLSRWKLTVLNLCFSVQRPGKIIAQNMVGSTQTQVFVGKLYRIHHTKPCCREKTQAQPVVLYKTCTMKVQWRSENECFSCLCSQPEFTDFVMAEFQESIQFCKINVMIKANKLFSFLECWSAFLKLYFSVMACLNLCLRVCWCT